MPFLTVSPECRFCMPAPESHHGVASLAPFRKVMARSYLIRTVIQLSRNFERTFHLFRLALTACRKSVIVQEKERKKRHLSKLISVFV